MILVEHHPAAIFCSFCGKGQREVEKMITGRDAFICDGCIKHGAAIVLLGKSQVFGKADLKRARAEARRDAFGEIVALMGAAEKEAPVRSRRSGPFCGIVARLRKAGGLGV